MRPARKNCVQSYNFFLTYAKKITDFQSDNCFFVSRSSVGGYHKMRPWQFWHQWWHYLFAIFLVFSFCTQTARKGTTFFLIMQKKYVFCSKVCPWQKVEIRFIKDPLRIYKGGPGVVRGGNEKKKADKSIRRSRSLEACFEKESW